MQTNQFTLPEWEMVGGESQKRLFTLYNSRKQECDLQGGSANFAVINYSNRYGQPYISKIVPIEQSETGQYSVINIELSPDETVDLSGKFIYQITVKDGSGNVAIPKHGIIYIIKNINTDFIKG